ncbi:hypothetical protein [Lysobacter olei]
MKATVLLLKAVLVAVLLLHVPTSLSRQVTVNDMPARPDDVSTLDGLMRAFYEAVNIGPDDARQWDRDRTLYVPWIRFVATSVDSKGQVKVRSWTHQQYVEATEPLVAHGFKEWEVSRKTQTYGNIAHIDSVYAGEATEDGKVERFRGVNSIEAYFDGTRWWISSVMWMSESPNHPIPPMYLEKH